jgi:hypothetical protein
MAEHFLPVRKIQHIAYKGGPQEVSYVQKLNKQAGWQRKKWHSRFSWQVWP